MLDFTGKTVLVTGGGAGIGRACADAFARQGARVFIAEIDAERLKALRQGRPSAATLRRRNKLKHSQRGWSRTRMVSSTFL